ncbi:MAG: hypothetical protein WAK93_21665 [Solirubrobacteraceae bacterium]
MRRHPWWSVTVVVILAAIVLVVWARTRPGFDPYGWLVWGHQTLLGSLDTNAAPSWKPLPYLFTVPYALAGHHELRLWMFTSAAVALAGSVFAGRIAYKLTDAPPERRWAGLAAGAFAGLALLGLQDYFHYILSSQSDPMIVTLCLAAIDCHLDERPRAAFVLLTLASLGRPEAWLFLGLYTLWAWRYRRQMRWLLVAGWVVLALLWFGIPALTSRTFFVAGANALDSGRALKNDRVFGTVKRFLDLHYWPLEVLALIGVVLAALRRNRADRIVLGLAGAVVAWVIVEIAFALHGWPGLARYMFEAAGVMVALAGAAVGRLLTDPPRLRGFAVPAWAAAGVAGVLTVCLIPPAISAARTEHKDLREQRLRTAEISNLTPTLDRLGGAARLRACGEPLTRLQYQTTVAYALGDNVNQVGFKYSQAVAHGNPVVFITPDETGIGWQVQALHQVKPECRSLPAAP